MNFAWDHPAPERKAKPNVFGLTPENLASMGCPGRPQYVFSQLQRQWQWEEDRPLLSKKVISWLDNETDTSLPIMSQALYSEDGSTKCILGLIDGEHIEAVHMPRKVRTSRVTLCISSQVGCAMGCTFCATGAMGIKRNLEGGEIVGQVLVLMRALGPRTPDHLTLVFMGMGEPLHNLKHVHQAIQILSHPLGLNISPRRITVSTSGLVPGIERLARMRPRPLLAISLNATTDEIRSSSMPINRVYNLTRLRRSLDSWNLRPNEKLTFEYVLMEGINDKRQDAEQLVEWLGSLKHQHNVNLIPMNEHDASDQKEPSRENLENFSKILRDRGCFVTVRKSRGRDIQAACGQLIRTI
mgnify:CR=1 FL=1